MLLCFGAAWPFSIYKSWKYRNVQGKSIIFMVVVLIGYLSGILHKIFYNYDAVVYLYMLNGLMVTVDIFLYAKYRQEARGNS